MGTPFAIFTLFGESEKTFYGEFCNSSFELTVNSALYSIPYLIEGKYKNENEFETEVLFKIKPIWFGFFWIRIFPVIIISLINFYFIKEFWGFPLGKETVIFFTIMNIILLTFFIPIFTERRKKNKMEKKFREIFEIKDEKTTANIS